MSLFCPFLKHKPWVNENIELGIQASVILGPTEASQGEVWRRYRASGQFGIFLAPGPTWHQDDGAKEADRPYFTCRETHMPCWRAMKCQESQAGWQCSHESYFHEDLGSWDPASRTHRAWHGQVIWDQPYHSNNQWRVQGRLTIL